MESFFSQFHLLRPWWLITLIPAIALFVFLLKRRLASARWNGIIDQSLMPHVLDQMPSEQSRWPLWFILLAWILTSIALSGPSWEQLPQPVKKKEDALVIVLDMSLSMAAQDVSPDRATRARQKVIDILKQRNEGLTALVVYAGDAYTVTPLTDDADTIINLVPSLSPFIMPAMGSRPDKALTLAAKLITDAGLSTADYLLITDGIQNKDIKRITKALGRNKQQLTVLTLGTEEGAPISMQGKGFKRDKNGNIVLPKLDLEPIKELANNLGIRWHQMSFDDRDWQYLLQTSEVLDTLNEQDNSSLTPRERQFDLWADQGYWLIILILIIAAFSYRRGWMMSLAFILVLQPEESFASLWQDAWQTKDQQGQQAFADDPEKAAELFQDPNWKGSSFYRAGDYEQAAESFEVDENSSSQAQARSHYNRGNALAHAGEYEKALSAYQQALDLNEGFADAQFNKQLIEDLLQQQEEQEQQDSDDKNSDEKDSDQEKSDNQNSDSQDSDQDSSDQEKSEQQDSEQENANQQDSDKQDSDEQEAEQQDAQQKSESDKEAEEQKEKSEEQQSSEQDEEEKSEAERQAQAEQAQPEDDLSREEKQALQQWLNRIPDDPGGLLKRKFLYQYKQREHQDEGEVSW